MNNPFQTMLMGIFVATAAMFAITSQTKPPPVPECKASDAALSQIGALVKENGQAVKDAQASLIEQLRLLNSLPSDKQEADKVLAGYVAARQELDAEKKQLAAQGCMTTQKK